jgi:hypothetical protein
VGPTREDMVVAYHILEAFGDVSGLRTTLSKSEVFPIACTEEKIIEALGIFPIVRGLFPCMYLVLLLHFVRLKAVHFQPLLDKLHARLVGWWGNTSLGCEGSCCVLCCAFLHGAISSHNFQVDRVDHQEY